MNTMRRAPGRRWHLRDATASEHEELDNMIGTFSDRASYAQYVAALHRFRDPLEYSLPPIAGFHPTSLSAALAQDLHDLDLPSLSPAPGPALHGSALLGTLYVLEGAALGSQILRKRAAKLGFDATFGARHLAGDTRNWLTFLAVLDAAPDYDPDLAVESARAAFASARTAFAKPSQ